MVNNCTSPDLLRPFDTWIQVTIVILQLIEAIFGSLASLCVIFVFFKRGRVSGVTALFMVNLAVADVLICVIMIPYSTAQILLFPRISVTSHIIHESLLSGLRFASIGTLVAISYDRMESITRPLRIHVANTKGMIILIWMLSIPSFIIPIFALKGTSFRIDRMCNAKMELYQLFNLIVFIIQCFALFYNYHSVQNAARNRATTLPIMILQRTVAVPEVSTLSAQLKHQKDKVVNLSRIIVTSVMLLWTPYLGVSFAKFFIGSSQSLEIASSVLLMIGYSNHVLHPILYAAPSSHWREAALKTFPFLMEMSRRDSGLSSIHRQRRVVPT